MGRASGPALPDGKVGPGVVTDQLADEPANRAYYLSSHSCLLARGMDMDKVSSVTFSDHSDGID